MEAAELDNGFVNILAAQMFPMEEISLIRVMPQIKTCGLLWYNQENVRLIESFYLENMRPCC